jgi:FkbH-like protein
MTRFLDRTSGSAANRPAAEYTPASYLSPIDVAGLQGAADFLSRWLQTRDPAYAELYRGMCVAQFARRDAGLPDAASHSVALLAAVDQRYRLDPEQRSALQQLLDETRAALPTDRAKLTEQRILFVGDCLFEEVALFLGSACLRDGILVRAEHIVSKNPLEQRRQLGALDPAAFFAVFYSPFSYEFNPEFAQLLTWSHARSSAREIDAVVVQATQTIARTIDELASTFECPIFVSNASMLQRGTSLVRRVAKSVATHRTRARARAAANAWLDTYLATKNRDSYRHLFVLDEAALVERDETPLALGEYLYATDALHPTRFSSRLATDIADRLQAAALSTRKLVVCDLDNTLWEGVIGEGLGVRHHHDRQAILAQLKAKGVILAIASKNDPEKIVWTGGTLDATCFVASAVSWAPKVEGIQRIYQELNIKPKDCVFIDDRPDERELVQARWPTMHVADPCAARTWRVFAAWADLLDDEQEFDRTAMYQQREQRDAAMATDGVEQEVEAPSQMFARLGLKATLMPADRSALKRVAELINRTNQWNLAASRTTYREVERWLASNEYRIITVQVDDRFGSMGTVCVAVVRERADHLEITAFVLSCRVFGFGVETLLLEHLKHMASRRFGTPKLVGRFTATEHNAPCKNMYRDHGFTPHDNGTRWCYPGGGPSAVLPTWFTCFGFDSVIGV